MPKYRDMSEEQRAKYIERVRKYQAEHKSHFREYVRKRKAQDLNDAGRKKSRIRTQSRQYLFAKHSKLEGYEIHHCFGYEDHRKFIYIPKTLHLQIHQILRDNKIPAESDHWMVIRDIVNSSDQYTYISM